MKRSLLPMFGISARHSAVGAGVFLVCCLFSPGLQAATTGYWNTNGNVSWEAPANWLDGIVPDAPGDSAHFTYDIDGARNIPLGNRRVLGELVVGDSGDVFAAYSLIGGRPNFAKLAFDTGGAGSARLSVPEAGGAATNFISTIVHLCDDLVIHTGNADLAVPQMTLSGQVAEIGGARSLTKTGPGTLTLLAGNAFSGGFRIEEGQVIANGFQGAIGVGPVIVEDGGQAVINASSMADFTLEGSGYDNSADPGALHGALLLADRCGINGNVSIGAAGARIGVANGGRAFILGSLSGAGDLEINDPDIYPASSGQADIPGFLTLHGDASGYTGKLELAFGGFGFSGAFGGSIGVDSEYPFTSLETGSSIAGGLSLASGEDPLTLRLGAETLAIGGTLKLDGVTTVVPTAFPAPGQSSHVLMTYAALEGDGELDFDPYDYRGAPVLEVGPQSAVVTGFQGQLRTWNGWENNYWSTWDDDSNWDEGDEAFKTGDTVVFPEETAGVVELDGTLYPASIHIDSDFYDYVFKGQGGIAGSCGITKDGEASVTLGGKNSFTGPVQVNAGTLKLGDAFALGYTSGVTVAAGATLDLNGQTAFTMGRTMDVTLEGTGSEGQGALISSINVTLSGSGKTGVRNVTLTGDATIGCPTGKGFDMGTNGVIHGGGHTLTKTGGGTLVLMGGARDLNLVIEEGIVMGFGSNPFGDHLTIHGGATATAGNLDTYSSNVTIKSGGKIAHGTGTISQWTGAFTAEGDVLLENRNTIVTALEVHADFEVPGDLLRTGGGNIIVAGNLDVKGNVLIDGGMLMLGDGGTKGSLGPTAGVTLTDNYNGLLTSLQFNRRDDWTFPNSVSGTGSLTKLGAGCMTLTGDCSHNGATTVSEGGLVVNGSLSGGGGVAVNSGTVLSGGGFIQGKVTIGRGAALARPADEDTLSVAGGVSLSGSLRVEYGAHGAALLDCGDALHITSDSSLVLEQAGGKPDRSSVIPLVRYSSRTGVLFGSISGMPEGYELDYAHVIDGVSHIALVPTGLPEDPYTTWITGFFPDETDPSVIGRLADPDGDGVPNILENHLGTNPAEFSPALSGVVRDGEELVFRHSLSASPLPDHARFYQWSTDLENWFLAGATGNGVTVDFTATQITSNPPPANNTIEVRVRPTGGDAGRLFVRIGLDETASADEIPMIQLRETSPDAAP